jgi:hypothetical protein
MQYGKTWRCVSFSKSLSMLEVSHCLLCEKFIFLTERLLCSSSAFNHTRYEWPRIQLVVFTWAMLSDIHQDQQKRGRKASSRNLLHNSNEFFPGISQYANPPPKANGEDDKSDGLIDFNEAVITPLGKRNPSSIKTHQDECDDLIYLNQADTKSRQKQDQSFAGIRTNPDSIVSQIVRPRMPLELDSWDVWNSLAIRKPPYV